MGETASESSAGEGGRETWGIASSELAKSAFYSNETSARDSGEGVHPVHDVVCKYARENDLARNDSSIGYFIRFNPAGGSARSSIRFTSFDTRMTPGVSPGFARLAEGLLSLFHRQHP
jgi:hypothetical protein